MPVLPPILLQRRGRLRPSADSMAAERVPFEAVETLLAQFRQYFGTSDARMLPRPHASAPLHLGSAGSLDAHEDLSALIHLDAGTASPTTWPESALLSGDALVTEDVTRDSRYQGHLSTAAGPARFFAGIGLRSATGDDLGMMYTFDARRRESFPDDLRELERFGQHAAALLELDRAYQEAAWERAHSQVTGQVLGMIATGAPLDEVLNALAEEADFAIGDTRCSIHLVEDGKLRNAIGPRLPRSYLDAFEGVAVSPGAGSCGSAAATGQTAIVADIATDPRWDGYRDLALPLGLHACWSVPLKGTDGVVIGTFALYYDEPREPTAADLSELGRWVQLAEVAIARAGDMAALRAAATRDPLTGLLNRAALMSRLNSTDTSDPMAVLFVDLDQFKFVNDTLGHETGDGILRAAADRIRGFAGPADTVARLGGDEFVVLLHGSDQTDICTRAKTLAHQIVDGIGRPLWLGDRSISLSASVGVALHDGSRPIIPVDLVGDADLAMYAAKRAGHNSVAFFSPHLREQATARLDLEAELGRALDNGEFDCAFQPTVRLSDNRVVGIEALLRWVSPTRGPIAPPVFIGVAEETGQIAAIGEFVLRKACCRLAQWRRRHPTLSDTVMWVNVSARQLLDPGFDELVARVLSESGLLPHHLGIEVTESIFIGTAPSARNCLLALRTMGVRVAIDDFGTGYSSLAQLEHLPVDVLKLDREFVTGLDADEPSTGIVQAIITLSRTMGLGVVAEGVETDRQRRRLMDLGCGTGQGFLWSPAVPADELPGVIRMIEDDRRTA